MFVFSLRGDKLKKAIVVIFAALAVIIAAFIFIKSGVGETAVSTKNGLSLKAANAEERIAFISQYGWEVSPDPLEVSEVIIPYEFDDTYVKYNELQSQQDMDLSDYKGIRVKRWTYEILNYPEHENSDGIIRANILIYNGRVIGGDVCNIELDGFMHTFAFPSEEGTAQDESTTQPETTGQKETSTEAAEQP